MLAVNWLTRTVAPSVTFGWQINLWGVGFSEWIYVHDIDPTEMAQQTADYVTSLGVYNAPYACRHFLTTATKPTTSRNAPT